MDIVDKLQRRFADVGLGQLNSKEITEMKSKIPELPQDYLDFLGAVGYGDLEELQIYGGPTSSFTVYARPEGDLSRIVLIGDDFQGYCFGFDTARQGVLVEVDPRGIPRDRSEGTFLALIERFFSDESPP